MVRRTTVLAALVALATTVASSPAESKPEKGLRSEGCIALGTHSIAVSGLRPWDCRFVATSATHYVAATTNPFVISIWDEPHERWNDVVRRSTPGGPVAGELATQAGDLVAVSISCWDYTSNTWCRDAIGGRYGTIVIHSEL